MLHALPPALRFARQPSSSGGVSSLPRRVQPSEVRAGGAGADPQAAKVTTAVGPAAVNRSAASPGPAPFAAPVLPYCCSTRDGTARNDLFTAAQATKTPTRPATK